VMVLREVRDILKEGSKKLNKLLAPVEQHLCQTIANHSEDGLTYHHPLGTVSATARGFFSINDPMVFYEWLTRNREDKKEAIEAFVTYAYSKKARTELCEALLEKGEVLPPGIKEYIIASVTVRRKSNG